MSALGLYKTLSNFFVTHTQQILLYISVISFFTLIAFIFIALRLLSISKKYRQLMKGADGKNIEALLTENLEDLKETRDFIVGLDKRVSELEDKSRLAVSKIYCKRYNPFNEMGSDLSFSVVFLNQDDTGVLLTSIYGRDENRIYLKPVKNGETTYALSPEEQEVLYKAKNQ
jgi:hypothetical protein